MTNIVNNICQYIFRQSLRNPTEHGAAILLLALHIKWKWRLETTFVNIFSSNVKIKQFINIFTVKILCYTVIINTYSNKAFKWVGGVNHMTQNFNNSCLHVRLMQFDSSRSIH